MNERAGSPGRVLLFLAAVSVSACGALLGSHRGPFAIQRSRTESGTVSLVSIDSVRKHPSHSGFFALLFEVDVKDEQGKWHEVQAVAHLRALSVDDVGGADPRVLQRMRDDIALGGVVPVGVTCGGSVRRGIPGDVSCDSSAFADFAVWDERALRMTRGMSYFVCAPGRYEFDQVGLTNGDGRITVDLPQAVAFTVEATTKVAVGKLSVRYHRSRAGEPSVEVELTAIDEEDLQWMERALQRFSGGLAAELVGRPWSVSPGHAG